MIYIWKVDSAEGKLITSWSILAISFSSRFNRLPHRLAPLDLLELEWLTVRHDVQGQNLESHQPAKRKSYCRERKGSRRKQIFKMHLPQNRQSFHPWIFEAMRSTVRSLGPCKSVDLLFYLVLFLEKYG